MPRAPQGAIVYTHTHKHTPSHAHTHTHTPHTHPSPTLARASPLQVIPTPRAQRPKPAMMARPLNYQRQPVLRPGLSRLTASRFRPPADPHSRHFRRARPDPCVWPFPFAKGSGRPLRTASPLRDTGYLLAPIAPARCRPTLYYVFLLSFGLYV